MDGYSVTEAASVLGVPTERVWELLARGVLSGAPEGDTGMRVYLQPRPKPAVGDDPGRPNGDRVGGEPERELSPFRELLTEFRGLTERYGQALLALGEARGEVAALRSRVDVLEARMDLRLPLGAAPSAPPWPAPVPEAQRAAAPLEHVPPEPDHLGEEEHRARSRGPRRATDSFAEALARAEDPSAPELPPAATHGEPHAAPRVADASEPGLPRVLPPADTVPVADEREPAAEAHLEEEPEAAAEPIAATEVEAQEPVGLEVEPEPVVVEAATPEPEPIEAEPELADVEPMGADAQPEPVEETMAATEGEAEPVDVEPEPAAEPVVAADVEAEPVESEPEPTQAEAELAPEPIPEPPAAVEVEPEQGAPEGESEGIDFDANRYSTAIEEPDWFEAEADEPVAQSTQPEPEPEAVPEPAREPEPEPEPEPVESVTADEPTPPHVPSAADEETMLWSGQRPAADTGADEMEVAGGGAAPSPIAEEPSEPDLLPGSSELDEALASLEELTRRTRQSAPGETGEWPPPSAGLAEPNRPTFGASRTAFPGGRPGSPATRAYRRLRRIFPG